MNARWVLLGVLALALAVPPAYAQVPGWLTPIADAVKVAIGIMLLAVILFLVARLAFTLVEAVFVYPRRGVEAALAFFVALAIVVGLLLLIGYLAASAPPPFNHIFAYARDAINSASQAFLGFPIVP